MSTTVEYKQTTGIIRLYSEGNSYNSRDEYTGVISVQWIAEDIALLYGALAQKGAITKKTSLKIYRELQKQGAKKIRMWRTKEKAVFLGKIIEESALEHLWEYTFT